MILSLFLAMGEGWETKFTGQRELGYKSHLGASPGLAISCSRGALLGWATSPTPRLFPHLSIRTSAPALGTVSRGYHQKHVKCGKGLTGKDDLLLALDKLGEGVVRGGRQPSRMRLERQAARQMDGVMVFAPEPLPQGQSWPHLEMWLLFDTCPTVLPESQGSPTSPWASRHQVQLPACSRNSLHTTLSSAFALTSLGRELTPASYCPCQGRTCLPEAPLRG